MRVFLEMTGPSGGGFVGAIDRREEKASLPNGERFGPLITVCRAPERLTREGSPAADPFVRGSPPERA